MHLSIGKAAALLGVSVATLRRWDCPAFRTSGGYRRYELAQLEASFHLNDSANAPKSTHALAYARVSSHDQKQDLDTQKQKLESYCMAHFESFEVLSDLGSGLNTRKPGLRKLLRLIFQRPLSIKYSNLFRNSFGHQLESVELQKEPVPLPSKDRPEADPRGVGGHLFLSHEDWKASPD
jgi:predicted site-specific integrase-resolvase